MAHSDAHDHDHPGHGQGHGGHSHGISSDADTRLLAIALALNASFMVVELVVGVIANSLALLSDAAHMLTDAGAIALALFAAGLARRRPKGAMTYGYRRAEILSALVNGVTLLTLAGFIAYEGVRRLVDPPTVDAKFVLAIGVAGLAVNGAAAVVLSKASGGLNVRGAWLHNLMDAYSSVGTAGAAGVILLTGFERADPIASLMIAAPMIWTGWGLSKAAGRVLLEAAPEDVDVDEIGRAMAGFDGVAEVHDLHVWEVSSGFPALSAHVLVGQATNCHEKRRELESMLRDRFNLDHTTLQVDHKGEGQLLQIELPGKSPGP